MKGILLIENDGFLRELLVKYFEETKRYEVIGAMAEGSNVLELCEQGNIHLALMDICTDDDNRGGIKAAKMIKTKYPDIKVVLMTGVPETDYMKEAKEAGVDSFLYKTDSLDKLLEVVDKTMEDYSIWPELSETPLKDITFTLSKRENEVARLICCECMTRQEIAKKLFISPDTVKTITSRVLVKVGVDNIRQLMSFMLSNDYFKPEEKKDEIP
ncbi:MAG: response regulator transcription factor [Tissierellia bacterium]|nr:response regulator transcription factor [Tissierellia bacterium]